MRGGNVYLAGNQLIWLAGLLEAEGSFIARRRGALWEPTVSITMTDYDVMSRVAAILGTKACTYHSRSGFAGERSKQKYRVSNTGGAAVSLMSLLRSLMGLRRQGQIDAAVACYRPLISFPYRIFHLIENEIAEYDRYWLSGYLEGEGWFGTARSYSTYVYPRVGVGSVDYDTIVRVQRIWREHYGADIRINSNQILEVSTKVYHRLWTRGATARAIMRDIYPLMGERRQTRIRQILAGYS